MADDEDHNMSQTTDPVKIQEGLLRKAQILKGNIDGFLKQLESAQPLPSYPSMIARLAALRDAVNDFTAETHKHGDLLATTVVIPSMQFPSKYHMGILETLMRTKMEPSVEDWEQQHLKMAHDRENKLDLDRKRGNMTSLSDADRGELWDWAAEAAQIELQKHPWFEADFTMAEKEGGIETVNHGLRRKLVLPEIPDPDAEDDDELFEDIEEDKQDVMELDTKPTEDDTATGAKAVLQQSVPMDKLFRFMTRGEPV